MKKLIWPGLVLLALATAVWFYKTKTGIDHSSAFEVYRTEGLNADRLARYRITLEARQIKRNQTLVLVKSTGDIEQFFESLETRITQWVAVQELVQGGHPQSEAFRKSLEGKAARSETTRGETQHAIAKDFPKEFVRTQFDLLQRLTLPRLAELQSPLERSESEEMSAYTVRYARESQGDIQKITKTWQSYDRKDLNLDSTRRSFRYYVAENDRLIAADGVLAFAVQANEPMSFEIYFQLDLIGTAPKPSGSTVASSTELERADNTSMQQIAKVIRARGGLSFEEASTRLKSISGRTDSSEVYLIFTALKDQVVAEPSLGKQLVAQILARPERDEATRRQLSVMFGALAQSESPALAEELARMAKSCPDLYCKEQAIVGLNDHKKPTPGTAQAMLSLLAEKSDTDTASLAALAAGSVARKLNKDVPEVAPQLIAALQKPGNADIRRSLIAGMGNHGDSSYLASLQQGLKDKEPTVRAASAYSLRHLKDAAVTPLLLKTLSTDRQVGVQRDALKALAYRSLSAEDYAVIGKASGAIKDQQAALEAAQLLIQGAQEGHQGADQALQKVQDQSRFPVVKKQIQDARTQAAHSPK